MNANNNTTIFTEMAAHGIDTKPFLEVVAKDLIKLFGLSAINHAEEIQQNFINNENIESAEIWHKIYQILLLLDRENENLIH